MQDDNVEKSTAEEENVTGQDMPEETSPQKNSATVTASVEGTNAETEEPSTNKRVLVVEDSLPLRRMLCKILSSDGLQVDEAKDGNEAIDKIIASKDNPYSLMLLDIMMPVLDGIKTMAKIKRDGIDNVPPVVICTCRSDSETVTLTQKLGAVDYILKPFKTDTIINRVRKLLAEAVDTPESSPRQGEELDSAPASSTTEEKEQPDAASTDGAEAEVSAKDDEQESPPSSEDTEENK